MKAINDNYKGDELLQSLTTNEEKYLILTWRSFNLISVTKSKLLYFGNFLILRGKVIFVFSN